MAERNQSKRHPDSTGDEEHTKKPRIDSGKQNRVDDNDTLVDISHEAVGKLLNRVNQRGFKKQDSFLNRCDTMNKLKSVHDDDQIDEPDWEDGPVNTLHDHEQEKINSVTIEFDALPDKAKRKAINRASAGDKERAELVHKVHLLCLLARGRRIDRACNDPLIQAALLALVPTQFLKISDASKLTAKALAPVVNWFRINFHVRIMSNAERSFESALALALETRQGTAEEVAALSVALFRALNLTTRFVSVLDVASLKPRVDTNESITKNARRTSRGRGRGLFDSSTLMMAPPYRVSGSPSRRFMSFRGMKRFKVEESSYSRGFPVSIGSREVRAPMHWAEVYCSGENLTGRWVHVDAVNAIIDGEKKVEDAYKTSLRYAIAFAGHGAKDVTRRYCTMWYKIASERINSGWWDAVLAPLKELEYRAAEDMELETRSLTEPLPTNQQAYRNHSLYALERWLTKYQILHPRGPILGFCSSHPVFPRTCVQELHTKERWLREGLQLKANELPVKVLKRSRRQNKEQSSEADDYNEGDGCGRDTLLYGRWQTEPLQLPHAVNGIVPRNERGQVDVWSEKCLPPGTVHLRLPRLVPIAERLKVDFAPAMVGFEFRNGRSFPVYEGIVVCTEFKDAILEAFTEEEEKRDVEEKRRNELQAISRWYQLLSSVVTRQRLKNRYGDGSASQSVTYAPNSNVKSNAQGSDYKDAAKQTSNSQPRNLHNCSKENARLPEITDEHEHVFVMDDQTTDDEESFTRIKRCHCGFYIEVEEL